MNGAGREHEGTEPSKIASDNPCSPGSHSTGFHFLLPKWPPSVNSLYQIVFSQRRVELKPEVRAWKTQMKELIPAWKELRGTERLLSVELNFYGQWFHSTKRLKKIDVQNMVKVTLDALCEKNQIDDSQVFECIERKKASLKEYMEGYIKWFA